MGTSRPERLLAAGAVAGGVGGVLGYVAGAQPRRSHLRAGLA